MAGILYNPGMESLRTGFAEGDMRGTLTDTKAFMKALSGDIVLKCTPATATPAPTAAAWSTPVVITLETADGELHKWFSGKLLLAIADTSTAGTASIDPTGTSPYMVDGSYTVNIKGDAAEWLNAETATLTVNVADQDPGGGTTDYSVLGYAVAAKTTVLTFTT
jgi:hypothetical protein